MSIGRHGSARPLTRVARSTDPVVAIQIYVVALIASPAVYVVGPLGAAGTPATLVGCTLLVIWTVLRVSRRASLPPASIVRTTVGIFAAAVLAAFAAGMLRPISGEEVSSAVRGLISVASWCGVILFTADSSRSRRFVPMLARTITIAGSAMAVLGIVQFATGIDYVQVLHLPGLVQNADAGDLYLRSGFTRVSGTALHSIEFAAVLSVCLPIAMHAALIGGRRLSWLPPALMFVALMLTVSRSGAVGLGIGLLCALLIATRRQRAALLLLIPVAFVALRLAVPGLVGTIQDLFFGAAEDSSVGSRVDDYAAVEYYIESSPLVGRGPFTFLPGLYRVLDNQYLATLIEGGVLGLVALIAFFVVPILTSLHAALIERHRQQRTFAVATASAIAAAALLSVTFDMFGFPIAMGMTCVIIGMAAAIDVNIGRRRGRPVVSARVRWSVAAGLAVALVLAPFAIGLAGVTRTFEARGEATVAVATAPGQNVYDARINSMPVPELMAVVMNGDRVRDALAAEGVAYYELALGDGSLAPFTDRQGALSSETFTIAARGGTVDAAAAAAVTVREQYAIELAALQERGGVPADAPTVVLQDAFVEPEVFEVGTRRDIALVGAILCAAVVAITFAGSRIPEWFSQLRRANRERRDPRQDGTPARENAVR